MPEETPPTPRKPHFMMQGNRPAHMGPQASHQAQAQQPAQNELMASLPEALRQHCHDAQQAAAAAAALGIDLATLWQLARPQVEAMLKVLLQVWIAKLAEQNSGSTVSPG